MTDTAQGQNGLRVIRFPEAHPQRDARVVLGPDWRYLAVNPAAERDLNRTAASLIGRCIWDEYQMLEETPLGTSLRYVMATREPYRARQSSPLRPDHLILTTIAPDPCGGISITYRNLKKAAERRKDYGT